MNAKSSTTSFLIRALASIVMSLILVAIPLSSVLAAATAATHPTANTNANTTSPELAYDGSTATAATFTASNNDTHYKTFGFSIPAGSTINTVTVTVRASTTGRQALISVSADGSTFSTTQTTAFTGSTANYNFTGASALWGLSSANLLTGLNANTFEVFIDGQTGGSTLSLYDLTVTIDYTAPTLPTVTTQAVSSIGTTTATGNGNITALGSSNPTQHGVVWDTAINPTIALATKTTDGAVAATGAFTSNITGLTPGVLYHVRAYATNSGGTSYGTDVTFTTATTLAVTGPASVTYGSTDTITSSGGSGGGAVTYSVGASTGCSITGGTTLNVTNASNSCTVTATKAASAPYAAQTSAGFTVTLNKATPTASITNSPVIYNGSAQTATVACLGGGTATLASGGTGTDVGSYPATVDCAASTNYNAATGLDAGSFVIDPATPTASITNSPVVYNGSAQTATVACSGGGTATLASGGTGTDAGSYPATVDCAASTNYNAAAGLAAGSFVIDPATPTASITNSPVIYNGSVQTATVACLGGGTATLASGGTGTDVGSYPATVDCAASTNYSAAAGLAAGSFVIDPASQTITFGALADKFVGDTDFAVSATASSGLAVSFSSTTTGVCTVTADGTVTHIVSAGICTIQADQAGDTNYDAAAPVNQSFTVHPAGSIVLTISGVTADNKIYDATPTATLNTGSAALVGVVPGDDVQLDSTSAAGAFADKNIGTSKTVTTSGFTLSGANAGKYSLSQPTATADITPKDLTVSAAGVNKAYNGTTAATVTLSSDALGGDSVTLASTSAVFADANVGNGKAVTVSGISISGADAGNYNLLNTTANTTANITQAPLTVTADNHSKTTGQPDPAFTFGYSGFVSGETSAVINILPTCGVSVPHAGAGAYPIVCSGGSDDNYNFSYVNGTLTINAVATQTFEDVPPAHPFWRFIEGFYAAGITSGCSTSPLKYCPDQPVTRGQMAVFIERALGNTAPAPSPSGMFTDVSTGDPFKPFIEQFYNSGITAGCSMLPLKYCPDQPVTRGQMAVFVERALGITAPAPSPSGMFTDVSAGDPFKPFIEQFYNDGITSGCSTSPLQYCPTQAVTRGQMAVFISKAFGIPLP